MSKRKRKEPEKLRAYGYVRVSTEEQAQEGVSLDAQEERIKAYAFAHGLELVKIFRDEGHSAKSLNRPAMQELLNTIKGKEKEALIIYKLDRLTRKTRDLLFLIEEYFQDGNTRFLSINDHIDTETAQGKFFLTMSVGMAQMELELISERTKAALQYKKETLGHKLGQVPYGYQRIDGKLVEHHEEKNVLRRIKRMRKEGLSFAKIANRLNQQGVSTRRKKNRKDHQEIQTQWRASTIHHLLNRKPVRK